MKHQKWLSVLFVVLALVIVSVLALPAQAAEESDLTFTLNADGQSYSVTACNTSASGELVIPSTHEGKPVTGIGASAFSGCTGLTSVTIGESVTTIGAHAFYDCTGLEEINFNATAMNDLGYDDDVFYNAGQDGRGITVNIGANVTRIPARLFAYGEDGYYPPEITIVNFAENSVCEMIGQQAFHNCGNLRSVAIPASVNTVQMAAFGGCDNLDHVAYGGTEGQWNEMSTRCFEANNDLFNAFCHYEVEGTIFTADTYCDRTCYHCSLCNQYFAEESSGNHSFVYGVCSNCGVSEDWSYRIDSPNDVTITGYNGAGGNVVIPAQIEGIPVTGIGASAFSGCTGLTSVTIGESVTTIGTRAFWCTGLTSLTIGESVTTIGEWAFYGCTGLEEINFNATAMNDPDYAFDNAGWNGSGITVNIGANVTRIPARLFYYINVKMVNFAAGSQCQHIGELAFSGCTGLTSLTIGESVTTIGAGAFSGCTGLTSLTIGESVATIGARAFYDCTGLEEINFNATAMSDLGWDSEGFTSVGINSSGVTVNIGANVTRIPAYLFYYDVESYWINVKTVNFAPGSVCKSIGDFAFDYCSSLTRITIPDSVETIGDYAFRECTNLTSATIPDGVTSIGSNAFSGCTGLTSLTIGESVTTIGAWAFDGCTGLTSLTIDESVTSIDNYAFAGCIALKVINFNATAVSDLMDGDNGIFRCAGQNGEGITVNIGANVTRIPAYLFYPSWSDENEPNIRTVNFTADSQCQSIGAYAFYSCENLQVIYIPASITSVGSSAFYSNMHVFYGGTEDQWHSISGYYNAYADVVHDQADGIDVSTHDYCATSHTYCALCEKFISETATGDHSFVDGVCSNCGISEDWSYRIDSPNDVTITGYNGSNSNVVIPTQIEGIPVTGIGDNAFSYCTSLQSITIPESVTTIGACAFEGCTSLQSVTIPESVATIGDYAFADCSGLEEINFNATAMENLPSSNYVFSYAGIVGDGITVNIGANVTRIPARLFYPYYNEAYAPNIHTVNFAAGSVCQSIGDYAFARCTGLTSVTIGESVTTIGDYAFAHCTGLTSVPIGESVTTIGEDAFYWCTGLTSVTIGESVTTIGAGAFYGCTSLRGIWVDEDNTTYSSDIHGVCFNKEKTLLIKAPGKLAGDYKIPDSVTTIVYNAFDGCTGLTSVTIGEIVTTIGEWAFSGCTGLTSVTIGESVTTIGAGAFYGCTGLISVTIGESVTTIGDSAFRDCPKLSFAFYPGTEAQVANIQVGKYNEFLQSAWHYEAKQIQFCGRDCYYCDHCRKSMTLLGEAVKATVTFQNWDGTTLDVGSYYWGELPIPFTKPTKAADDTSSYTFVGWDELVVPCVGNTTYTAEFVPVCKHYVVAFKDWDGRVISSVTYHYGDTVLVPAAPTRPADNQSTYTFSGWDSEIVSCAGNATYTATYTATDIDYTVAFMNWNGSVIDYGVYHYGDVLNFPVVPNRPSDNKYTYTFAGWDSADTSCSGNAVYTAVFKQTEINYTVVFKNWDGTVISSKTYHYGDAVTAPSAPTRASDNVYSYTFDGWDKAVVDCSGNATYTALYKSAYRSYTVTFKNWDGTVLSTKTYHYGDTILAPSVPKRPNDSKYSYTYVGWDGVVDKCTGNATYTAVFTAQSLVPTTVTSTKHTVSGGTISKIGVGTTVSTLLGNLNERDYAKVYQGNNTVTGSALIGTGMEVKIMDGSTVKATATVVVTGDTNGDGKLTITDMLAAKAHVLKKNTLQGASSQAADTNGDGGISITDFIQMKAHILGKSTVEPKSAVTTVSVGVVLSGAVACAAEAQPVPQAETETVSAPAPVDVILPDKKLFALA